jgi:hypothetical protein
VVKSKEMTGKELNTAVVAAGGEGQKTTEIKMHCLAPLYRCFCRASSSLGIRALIWQGTEGMPWRGLL